MSMRIGFYFCSFMLCGLCDKKSRRGKGVGAKDTFVFVGTARGFFVLIFHSMVIVWLARVILFAMMWFFQHTVWE